MNQVRYFYQSSKRSKKKGIYNPYIFYLELKSICKDGFFKKGEVLNEITSKLNYSKPSVSILFKKLIACNLLVEYKTKQGKTYQYVLVSYKKAYKILGFKNHYLVIPKWKYGIINFSLIKDKNDLKAHISSHEVYHNSLKQKFNERDKLDRKIDNCKKSILKERSIIKRKEKVAKLENLIELRKGSCEIPLLASENSQSINEPIQTKLSCKTLATLSGFKSSMTGLKLEKNSQTLGLLSIKKETIIKATVISKKDFENNFVKYQRCFWSFGKVYERKCNTLTLEPLFLSPLDNILKTCHSIVKHDKTQ